MTGKLSPEKRAENEYSPDVVTPPGETLRDILNDRRITSMELAKAGLSLETMQGLIRGDIRITPEIANALEGAIGTPASFWLNRQKRWEESQGA